jgi:hypothetical protein
LGEHRQGERVGEQRGGDKDERAGAVCDQSAADLLIASVPEHQHRDAGDRQERPHSRDHQQA